MSELIDIGANLTHDSFDDDRDEVIARASAAGVTRLIVTGATLEGSRQAAALAEQYPGQLYATAGVHPHHATEFDSAARSEITELARVAVAVGECGLDYFRDFSPRDQQLKVFEEQLQVAVEIQKPVFLHSATHTIRSWPCCRTICQRYPAESRIVLLAIRMR